MKLRAQSISCAASASLALVALFVPTSVAHSSTFLFLFVLAALCSTVAIATLLDVHHASCGTSVCGRYL